MAEKKVIELEVKTESLKPLKAQLREAQAAVAELSEKFGATSKEAIAAAKRAAELKDAIADAKALTDAYNPDAKFNALSSAIGGVLNGFQAFEGALGLVGVEGKAVEETLLKVQSAMALTQGINGVLEAKEDFARLGKKITDVYAKAVSGFQNMTAAGKAFAITGIGLVITGLGLVIAYWDDIKKALSSVSEEQKLLNSTLDDYKQGANDAIKKTTEVGNAFMLAKKGVMSKGEALKIYNDTLGDSFGKAKNLNDAEKLYLDKTDAYIKATALRAQAQALFNEAAKIQAESLVASLEDQRSFAEESAGILTDVGAAIIDHTLGYMTDVSKKVDVEQGKIYKNAQKRAEKEKKAQADKVKNLAENLLLEAEKIETNNNIKSETQAEYDKEQLEKLKAQRQKLLEAQREADIAEIAAKNEFLAALEQAETEYYDTLLTNQQKEIQSVNDKYFELITRAKQYGQDTKVLEESRAAELKKIDEKYEKEKKDRIQNAIDEQLIAQEEFDKAYREATQSAHQNEIEAINEKYFYLIETAKQNGYDIVELEKKKNKELQDSNDKYRKEEREKDLVLLQQKTDAVTATLQTISDLTVLFAGKNEEQQKRAFKIQKAVNIASAVVDTYKAANVALASAPPPFNFVQMAAVIAAGLVNIKKIASTQFEGGGATSAGGGGGSTTQSGGMMAQPANFNIVGNAGANPLAALSQPIQAYVVSGEVTTAQALDRNKVNFATFG